MNRFLRLFLLAIPWLGTWIVHRQAQAHLARFRRLLDDLNNIDLKRMEVRDSEILMELAKDSLGPTIWAGIWQEVIDAAGAPNFLEFKFAPRLDSSCLVVTVQRVPGKTPADKLRDAETAVERLTKALKRVNCNIEEMERDLYLRLHAVEDERDQLRERLSGRVDEPTV